MVNICIYASYECVSMHECDAERRFSEKVLVGGRSS